MALNDRLREKVYVYHADQTSLEPIRTTPKLFTVGITAAGKNAITDRLKQLYPNDYYFVVSHTTRVPRENHGIMETDGVEYHFVDVSTMERLLDEHAMVEATIIHEAWVSGASINEFEKASQQHKIAISDIDIKGVAYYKKLDVDVRPVFLIPPSYDVWMERLLGRYHGRPDMQDLFVRMQTALMEIEHAMSVNYYYIVVNDDLDTTTKLINDISHGEPVDKHSHRAIQIADEMMTRLRAELA